MEDLRKSYNVVKEEKRTGVPTIYKTILRKILYFAIIAFILFYPDLIGEYVGKWMDSLYTSFNEFNTIKTVDWYTSLATIFTITIIYTILKWIRK